MFDISCGMYNVAYAMSDINPDVLEPLFHALGEQLAARGSPTHRVVIGGSGLLAMGLGEGFAERMTTVHYGPALRVSFASRFDQVQLKLYALADRHEPRDEADLRCLDPSADELRAGAQWARRHNAPGPFDDQLARALRSFGVEDAGRDG